MPDWLSRSRALVSTSVAALPVASAAVVTPPIWALISLEPAATCWMLRAISRVASPCCSIEVEMLEVISLIWAIVCVMPLMAETASLVDCCMAATWPEISSVALAVWFASAFTSDATTAKPRPDSPARAASMVALSAKRLVWAAMLWISFTTSPIFSAPVESTCTVAVVRSASPTAWREISLERATWARNLGDRARQLFGRGRNRTDIGRGALRSRPHRRSACAGIARGRRHRLRGGLHARRRARHRTDDAIDAALEIIGEAVHRRAALRGRTGLG